MARTRPRDDEDIYRTVPLTGTPAKREQDAALGKLLPMEFHTDTQYRAFIANRLVAPRIHEAESEDEMLNLYRVSIYGVKRADFCQRTDDPSNVVVWVCLGSNGATLDDWQELRAPSPSDLPSLQYVATSGLDGDGKPTLFFTDEGSPLYVPRTF